MGSQGEEKALPIIEIIPKNDLYDYESKYSPGGSEHVIPAQIDNELTKIIQDYAVMAHQVLGCKTYSRVEFILTENNLPIILEVITYPDITHINLFLVASNDLRTNTYTMLYVYMVFTTKH